MNRPKHGLFIAGTNTEVGKTFIASQIAVLMRERGVRVGVYKPVASGCRIENDEVVSDDAVELWNAAGSPLDLEAVCPQRFLKPVAPHLAAKAEGRESNFKLMLDGLEKWSEFDFVIVEGAGGLMSPLAEDWYSADLAFEIGFPVVVVAANRLGVINETLQTLITAATFRDGLDVRGIVLNDVLPTRSSDVSCDTNWDELLHRSVPQCLCRVTHKCLSVDAQQAVLAEELAQVDWLRLVGADL